MGDRAVLPMGQTNPQNHPFCRYIPERRTYPDRGCTHRLPSAPPRSGGAKSHSKPNHLRPADPRQPHAPSPNQQPARNAANPSRPATDEPKSMLKFEPDSRGTSPAMTMWKVQRLTYDAMHL